MAPAQPPPSSGNTKWTWRRETPLSRFLRTESGSAAVLLAATLAALVWANVASASYQAVWHTILSVQLGGSGVAMNLVDWVNSALMTRSEEHTSELQSLRHLV